MSNPQKIVVVGAGGRLGSALMRLEGENFTFIGLSRSEMNLMDHESINRALESLEFDQLVLAGALTAVDYCEDHREEAFMANAEGPREIARICANRGARVTYISTDFVFDGQKEGPYVENDAALPISVYGASKLKGEEFVMGASSKNLVVRVSWLYGAGKAAFPEWIIGKAQEESSLSLPEEKVGSPTCVVDLVGLLEPLLEDESCSGVYHLCNAGSCSWREWGQLCLDVAKESGLPLKTSKLSGISLDQVEAFAAKRPVNSVLSTQKYIGATGVVPDAWEVALRKHLCGSEILSGVKA